MQTTEWLQRESINVSLGVAQNAVEMVASERLCHPVLEYLDSDPCQWDGVARIEFWMAKFLGVADDSYTRTVSRCFLISAIARVRDPGCKVDTLPILEGLQGIGKSTVAEAMFSPWFSDEIADLGSKDASMQMQGVWCIEIAELDAMSRPEISKVKAFISRKVDRFRPPYGRHVVSFLRQCVFLGSTNSTGYLKDETGGRRYWPCVCGKLDIPGLRAARDQLWAEADHMYQAGVAWWIVNPNVKRLAEAEQADRYQGDAWDHDVAAYLMNRTSVTIHELLHDAVHMHTDRQGQVDQNRIVRILRSMGWEKYRSRNGDDRAWRYRRKFETAAPAALDGETCEENIRIAACFVAYAMEVTSDHFWMN